MFSVFVIFIYNEITKDFKTLLNMKFTKEDIENFSIEVCSKCHCKQACENMNLKKEACGKMFNWKIGYRSFITDVLEKQRKEAK